MLRIRVASWRAAVVALAGNIETGKARLKAINRSGVLTSRLLSLGA
jgi:hypothetical protein